MRKIILEVAVSLDGFIEGPNGEYDWCFNDQDYDLPDFIKRVDSLFMGRKTYEMVQAMGAAAPGFPNFKEYIFSTTLDKVKDGAILIKDNIKEEVEKIKNDSSASSESKDIWLFGGAGLTTSLINLGLVDEFSLAVHPIILGAGKPLFSNINGRIHLKLIDSKTYSTGLARLKYQLDQQ
jgi:dihydrofolate reductase